MVCRERKVDVGGVGGGGSDGGMRWQLPKHIHPLLDGLYRAAKKEEEESEQEGKEEEEEEEEEEFEMLDRVSISFYADWLLGSFTSSARTGRERQTSGIGGPLTDRRWNCFSSK